MKKLVIALGVLSACANSDAMQDGGFGDRSTNRRTFVSGAALASCGNQSHRR